MLVSSKYCYLGSTIQLSKLEGLLGQRFMNGTASCPASKTELQGAVTKWKTCIGRRERGQEVINERKVCVRLGHLPLGEGPRSVLQFILLVLIRKLQTG